MERIREILIKKRLADRFNLEQPEYSAAMLLSDVVLPVTQTDDLLRDNDVFQETNWQPTAAGGVGRKTVITPAVNKKYVMYAFAFLRQSGDATLDELNITTAGQSNAIPLYQQTAANKMETEYLTHPIQLWGDLEIQISIAAITTDSNYVVLWYGYKEDLTR